MAFNMPDPEILKSLGVAGLNDVRNLADEKITEIRASATAETITDEQANAIEALTAGIEQIDELLDAAERRAASFNKAVPQRKVAEVVTEVVEAAVNTRADEPTFNDEGVKDVATQTTAPAASGQVAEVVSATVTAAGAVAQVRAADVAPYTPQPEMDEEKAEEKFSIIAAANLSLGRHGRLAHDEQTDWSKLGQAFDELAKTHDGYNRLAGKQRMVRADQVASIRRNATEGRVIMERDNDDTAFTKLQQASEQYANKIAAGRSSLEAANGWCAPSVPDYSICSPITDDGLLQAPEVVANRGGIIHNTGLDFADFFGNDFSLPIPGYNILTEAQVIADTAKTCLEIPCPTFVDDRLNVAALCLTGSLLQNRGYPEFVSTFVQGATMAMSHLVNREIINAIETASTTVALATVDPWVSDGSVVSQVMSAVEMAIMDMRYAYRTSRNQRFDVIFPYWLRAHLRADWLRRNAAQDPDLVDSRIDSMLSNRGANVQWVYDWQDAFNPGAIPAANQAGNATPILSLPFTLTFLVYLPGTWVIARNDVVNLNLVYDSAGLAQNQVTQVFVEDGWKPMQMCPFSRDYTINICPSGSSGVQRAVTCTDVTP